MTLANYIGFALTIIVASASAYFAAARAVRDALLDHAVRLRGLEVQQTETVKAVDRLNDKVFFKQATGFENRH